MAKKDNAQASEAEMMAISRALADPSRLKVFRSIANKDNLTCSDLRGCLAMNPATLSHHMRQLEGAGLIETHRDGKYVRAEIKRKLWKSYIGWLKQMA